MFGGGESGEDGTGYTDAHYLDEIEGTKEETLFLATCTGKEVLDLL